MFSDDLHYEDSCRGTVRRIYDGLAWLMFGGLLALVVLFGLQALAHGGDDLVDLTPAERIEVYQSQCQPPAIIDAQCPGGVCPGGSRSIPYAPRSPRQQYGQPYGQQSPYAPVPPPIREYAQPPAAGPSASAGSGVPQLAAATHDAVCRITMDSRNAGSGTLVYREGSAGIVATCAHMGSGPCTLAFRGGQTARGELLVDRDRQDIGVVFVPQLPAGIEPVSVAEDLPQAGEWVLACGYGGSTGIELYAAQPNRVLTINTAGREELIEMQGQYRSGDSGGVVFNNAGELVGVINASSRPDAPNQENVATSCRRLKGLLARARERFGFRGRGDRAGPGEVAPGIPIPQVERESQPSGGCKCDDTAVLAKLEELISLYKTEAKARQTEHAALVSNLENAGKWIVEEKTTAAAERKGVLGKLDELKQKLHDKLSDVATREDVGAVVQEQSSIREIIAGKAPAAGWTIGKLLATALGLSTPLGLGLGVAGWVMGRRVKKKIGSRRSEPGTSETTALQPRTVIVETPPPPQAELHHTQFVQYENTAADKAWAKAVALVGEENPSSVSYLKMVESLKNQLLAGQSRPSNP